MPTVFEHTNEENLAYHITNVRLEFDFTENTTLVTSSLTYVLDAEHGKAGDKLILKGKDLKLVSVFLNGTVLSKDAGYYCSPHGTTLIIQAPPENGIIKIATMHRNNSHHDFKGVNKTHGIFNIYCNGRDFEHITYFINRNDNLATYTTEFIYDPAKINLTHTRGEFSSKQTEGIYERSIWIDNTPRTYNGFYLIAGNFDATETTYISLDGTRTISIKFFTLEVYQNYARMYVQYIQNVMRWYEQNYNILLHKDNYEIIAAPVSNPDIKSFDLNVYITSKLFLDLNDYTDEQYFRKLGIFFWNFFDTIAASSDREIDTAKNLTRIYMDYLFGYPRSIILTMQNFPANLCNAEWVQSICDGNPIAYKWLEIQNLFHLDFRNLADSLHRGIIVEMPCTLLEAFREILTAREYAYGFKADALTLPTKEVIERQYEFFTPSCIHRAYTEIEFAIAITLESLWYKTYKKIQYLNVEDCSPSSAGITRLKNLCLHYLSQCKNPKYLLLCDRSRFSPRMSERFAAGNAYDTLSRSVTFMSASYYTNSDSSDDDDFTPEYLAPNPFRSLIGFRDTRLDSFKKTGIYAANAATPDINIRRRRLSL